MPKINVTLKDAQELEIAPEGEYDLRIVKAEDGESKSGNDMTTCTIAFEGHPEWQPVRHWITYPNEDTPPDQRSFRLIDIKRFLHCFGVAYDDEGFDTDDLVGQTGRCLVIQEEADDGNTYNRIKPPRLRKVEERRERIRR
jgi:Protein of unknown function (DUF669)